MLLGMRETILESLGGNEHAAGTQTHRCIVIHVEGEIDRVTAPMLVDQLDRLMDQHLDVIAEMTEVSYFDLGGVRAIEWAVSRFGSTGKYFLLACASSHVRRILDVMEVPDVLSFPSVAKAQEFLVSLRA